MVGIGTLVLPVLFSQDSVLRVTHPYPRTDEPLRLAVGHRYGRFVGLELGTRRLCPEVAEREPAGLVGGLDAELQVGSQVHARKVASLLWPWGWCRSRRWRQRRMEGSEIGALSNQVRSSWPRPASRARRMACVRSAICSLVKMFDMWLRTVLGLTNKSLAILALLWLWAMRSSTSRSRAVSSGKGSAGEAGRGAEKKSVRRLAISAPK